MNPFRIPLPNGSSFRIETDGSDSNITRVLYNADGRPAFARPGSLEELVMFKHLESLLGRSTIDSQTA